MSDNAKVTLCQNGTGQRYYQTSLPPLTMPLGDYEHVGERRTSEQNDRMWAMLTDISQQVEWPVDGKLQKLIPEDWKHILSAGLKREQRVAQGVDGGFVILGQRTSKMTKRQLSDLLELIAAFGAERGVVWSEPEEAAA